MSLPKIAYSVLTQVESAWRGDSVCHRSLYHNGIVIARVWAVLWAVALAGAQVIEFESNGLKYQTLTKSSVTVMFANLPTHIHEYAIIQVAVSNGAAGPVVVRPEDFVFERADGVSLKATPASNVVGELINKGNRSDVIKLVSTYEMALFGMS